MKKMSVVILAILGVTGLAQAALFPTLSPFPSYFPSYGIFAQSGSGGTDSLYVKDLSGGYFPTVMGVTYSPVGDDYRLKSDIYFNADTELGLLARASLAGQAYELSLNPVNDYLALVRIDSQTSFINLGAVPAGVDVQVGQTYQLTLLVQGSSITGRLFDSAGNLMQTISATDSTYATGLIGTFSFKHTDALEGTWTNMDVVPEPFTLVLLALGGLGVIRRRA